MDCCCQGQPGYWESGNLLVDRAYEANRCSFVKFLIFNDLTLAL